MSGTGRLRAKPESTFGKPKSSWTFGKPKKEKPQKEQFDVPIYEPPKQNTYQKKREKILENNRKIAHTNMLKKEKKLAKVGRTKGSLPIKEYMKFLDDKNAMNGNGPTEKHHWMPRSRIQQNDFFVICIPVQLHKEIHSFKGVNQFIEEYGEDNLMIHSIKLFTEWITTTGKGDRWIEYYRAMIEEIIQNPTVSDAVRITKFYAEEIRLEMLNNGR